MFRLELLNLRMSPETWPWVMCVYFLSQQFSLSAWTTRALCPRLWTLTPLTSQSDQQRRADDFTPTPVALLFLSWKLTVNTACLCVCLTLRGWVGRHGLRDSVRSALDWCEITLLCLKKSSRCSYITGRPMLEIKSRRRSRHQDLPWSVDQVCSSLSWQDVASPPRAVLFCLCPCFDTKQTLGWRHVRSPPLVLSFWASVKPESLVFGFYLGWT